LASSFAIAQSFYSSGTNTEVYDYEKQQGVIEMYKIFTLSIFAATMVPFILVINRLCKRGTSADLRQIMLKRHAFYFVLYLGIIVTVIFD